MQSIIHKRGSGASASLSVPHPNGLGDTSEQASITFGRHDDRTELTELYWAAGRVRQVHGMSDWSRNAPEIADEVLQTDHFVLRINELLVGAVCIKHAKPVTAPPSIEAGWPQIARLAVDPAFSGQGLGARLLGEVERYCRDSLGCAKVYLFWRDSTSDPQSGLGKIYLRNGYQHEGTVYVEADARYPARYHHFGVKSLV